MVRVIAQDVESRVAGPAVREIAERRNEKRDLRRRRSLLRPHEERHVVLGRISSKACGIDAALEIRRHLELESWLPFRIFQIVVVKVNRAVLVARVFEIHLPARPVVARDRARRRIDRNAIELPRRRIGDDAGRNVEREIPRRDRIGRTAAQANLVEIAPAQRATVNPRVVDLAVEVTADGGFAAGSGARRIRRDQKRRGIGRERLQLRGMLGGRTRRIERELGQRLLNERGAAGRRVVRGRDEIPRRRGDVLRPRRVGRARNRRHPRPERHLRTHLLDPAARSAEPQGETRVVLDEQTVSALIARRPLRQNALIAVGRAPARRHRIVPRRRDPRRHREAARQTQRRIVAHDDVRSEGQRLALAGVFAVGRRLHHRLFHPGTLGVDVAVDDANDVDAIPRRAAAHHELDRITGLRRHVIRVADDSHPVEPFLRGRLDLRRLRAPDHQRERDDDRDPYQRAYGRHANLLWWLVAGCWLPVAGNDSSEQPATSNETSPQQPRRQQPSNQQPAQ